MSEIRASTRKDGGRRESVLEGLPEPAEATGRLGYISLPGGMARPTPTVSLRTSGSTPVLFPERRDEPAAEQYRILRTRIAQQLKSPALIAVSSPGIGDGNTVISVNLAGVLALNSDKQVLLLDADLRRSTTHAFFELEGAPGLADVLEGRRSLQEVLLQVASKPNFYFLPPGEPRKNPADLFDSLNWPGFAHQIREQFGLVVVDTPPVEAIADYDLITAECDGIILVVRQDHTRRRALANALKRTSEKLLGVVLNDVEDFFLCNRPSFSEYRHIGKERN